MSAEFVVVNGTTPTGTGNQSFTSSGFGTPTAAIIFVTAANTTNNPEIDSALSIGFTDGTRENAVSTFQDDGAGNMRCKRSASVSDCIYLTDLTAVDLEANFNAWVTDGIQLNFTDVTIGLACHITVVLIKGTTNVRCDSVSIPDASTVNVEAPTFKPNLLFTTTVITASQAHLATTHGAISFGAAHNNSSDVVTNGFSGYYGRHGTTTDVPSVLTNNANCAGGRANTTAWYVAAESFDSLGFSLNPDSSLSSYVYYLAIDTGDEDGVDISVVDSPTTTGTWNVEDPAFEPQISFLGLTTAATVNTFNDADPMGFGLGIFDDTTEACIGVSNDDAHTTADTQSNYSTSNAVQLYHYSSGHVKFAEGSFTSFDSLGYNMSFPTTVDGTARKWLSIAIEKPAAAPAAGNPWYYYAQH